MNRQGTPENLRPFKRGDSGNPHGRPRTAILRQALVEKLAQAAPGKQRRTVAEQLAETLIAKGLEGDVRAICEIRDTCEGRPVQRVETASASEDQLDPAEVDRLFYEIYGLEPRDSKPQ
jgi:hypothetical protein